MRNAIASSEFGAATKFSAKFQSSSSWRHSKEIFKKGDRRVTSKGWNILWNNLSGTQTAEEDADSRRLTFLPLICRVSFSPLGSQPQTCQPAITMSCCYNTAVISPNLPLWLPATPINPRLDAHVRDVSGKRRKRKMWVLNVCTHMFSPEDQSKATMISYKISLNAPIY